MSADTILPILVVAAAGLCVGSFLNTCIYRVPRGLSVLSPRSVCPHCGEPLKPSELIPLWSFIWQGGRCAHCRVQIRPSYPIVEMATALFAVALYRQEGFSVVFIQTFGLACVFLAIAVVDYWHQIIPDGFVIAGLAISFLGIPWSPHITAWQAGMGFLVGGISFIAVQKLYRWIRGREGMGDGDVKLSALMGSVLGVVGWLQAIILASVGGAIAGGYLVFRKRATMQTAIPFGAYLSGGAILVLLVARFIW